MQGMWRVFIFLFMFWLVLHTPTPVAKTSQSWTGEVVSVSDGDSFKVQRDRRVLKVRLFGIDSPEIEQTYGRDARNATRQWLGAGRQVEVEPMYKDSYGRTVALVWAGGKLVNAELVKSGAAWVYPRFCRSQDICQPMIALQEQARQAGLGLWRDKKPEPPWQWKRRQPQDRRR